MTETDPDFVPWCDPLGTVPPGFAVRERLTRHVCEGAIAFFDQIKTPQEIAPIFCDLFGRNVYTVRKYFGSHYPILPERAAAYPGALFPSGPPDQGDLVKLEREGNPDFFDTPFGARSSNVRAARAERALRWLKAHHADRLEELRDVGAKLRGDLTTADDRLAEVIVAFLAAECAKLPASSVEFIKAKKDEPRPEFRIVGDRLRVVLEVKRIQKFPMTGLEDLWLRAYRRDESSPSARRIYDNMLERVQDGLTRVPEGQTVQVEEPPWQKTIASIAEQVRKADRQLASATEHDRKVVVLYSDDPHTLTLPTRTGEGSRINRVEAAVADCLTSLAHADAVVVLGHFEGFPIGNGHCAKFFWKDGRELSEVAGLFDGLPELRARAFDYVVLGAQITLPPNGTGTLTIRPE